ncbi:hypothetical protein [Acetobacter estunensis]|uniref:hypothetical protein n=1 Tax=Acetobacter estunensis TaxID=104097 RepID=UPI001C2D242E|nr:hypothetical protein [Acetobacter estunensis]
MRNEKDMALDDDGHLKAVLDQIRQAIAADRETEALAACEKALALWPDIRQLRGLLLDLAQRFENADKLQVCDLLRRTDFLNDAQDADIASVFFNAGLYEDALPRLRRVTRPLQGEHFSAWNYIRSLEETGRFDEIVASGDFLDALASKAGGRISLYSQLANARLARVTDRAALVRQATELESSALWLNGEGVAGQIRSAIEEARPFSLLSCAHERARLVCATSLHANLLLRPREIMEMTDPPWQAHFGVPFATLPALELARLGTAYRETARLADIVCLPGAETLARDNPAFGFFAEQERELSNYRNRFSAVSGVMQEVAASDPGLKRLLGHLPFVGMVTDQPGLTARMAAVCDVGAVTEILLADLSPVDAIRQIEEIWVPYPGSVFLVAAGLLTPLAIGRIRELGGIALDVENCVGTWAE